MTPKAAIKYFTKLRDRAITKAELARRKGDIAEAEAQKALAAIYQKRLEQVK